MIDAERDAIASLAQRLGTGQYSSQLCPSCEGGKSKEKTLSVDVGTNGIIKFNCFRASCGFAGQVWVSPLGLQIGRVELAARSATNPLTADIHPLSEDENKWFCERFHIPEGVIKENVYRTETRYVLPIRRPDGGVRGHITRRPWDGSPADTPLARKDPDWSRKALTYMEADEPVLSWYGGRCTAPRIYLVEDPISAMRLDAFLSFPPVSGEADYTYPYSRSVALMGTGVNAGKIAEIQREAYGNIVTIALDKDATGQAFAMARKWGQAFSGVRVLVLDKDIKDCTDGELMELPL